MTDGGSHLSQSILTALNQSSWIRKMFEEGGRLIKTHGKENVYDLSIGNPVFEPPEVVKQALIRAVTNPPKGLHRYMPNAGFPHVRDFVAQLLKKETNLEFTLDDIVFCTGAASGINLALKALVNPGDKIAVFAPYFAEYGNYAHHYQCELQVFQTTSEFQLDLDTVEATIDPKTRVVLLNSPNNPSGAIYPKSDLVRLAEILRKKSREFGHPITLISDEPYKRIVFDGVEVPSLFPIYEETVVVTSFSKDLALPGERIGYLAISPNMAERKLFSAAMSTGLRVLGYVNAPALFQHILPEVATALVDLSPYQKNRDLLHGHLTKLGFECVKPQGAFYLFPKSPIPNEIEFVQKAATDHQILFVPGRGFGQEGYFRISYCFETEFIQRTLPILTKVAQAYFS